MKNVCSRNWHVVSSSLSLRSISKCFLGNVSKMDGRPSLCHKRENRNEVCVSDLRIVFKICRKKENFYFSSNSFELVRIKTNYRIIIVDLTYMVIYSLFHLALHSRINSLFAYFKVSFHSAIFARARLVSGLSRFFVKKEYIYYEVMLLFSRAARVQRCSYLSATPVPPTRTIR